jgi:hypothetical protein
MFDQLGVREAMVHVLDRIVEASILREMADGVAAAGGQDVEEEDPVAARQVGVVERGYDEARAIRGRTRRNERLVLVGAGHTQLSNRWLLTNSGENPSWRGRHP